MSETRNAAFATIRPTLTGKQEMVLNHITLCNSGRGVCLHALVICMNWPVNRISGRVTELRRAGKIKDSGKRRVNPASGKSAVVWVAV